MKAHVHTVVFTVDGQDRNEVVPCTGGALCEVTTENRATVFVGAAQSRRKAK